MTQRKILVVGQTPPPFGGQAIMIEEMLCGEYENIKLDHVRMAFSKEMDEIGKVKLFKFFHLFEVVFLILYKRIVKGIDTLYFPPTGPNKFPFYRDAFILILVRPFFKKTCFHFHASGISDLYPQLNFISKILFRLAYYNADIGIRLSRNSPDDCAKLSVKKEYIIPNGIKDNYLNQKIQKGNQLCTILFVGLLNETKGLPILIEAGHLLDQRGIPFLIDVMGKFESEEFEALIKNKVASYNLHQKVTFLGVLTGEAKFKAYSNADIFCFPSYFESENFPVVILEASSFSLPVVSTQWRGIPSIVEDGKTGLLCPIRDFDSVAHNLQILIEQKDMRITMGENGRKIFLEKFTINSFYKKMEMVFSSL